MIKEKILDDIKNGRSLWYVYKYCRDLLEKDEGLFTMCVESNIKNGYSLESVYKYCRDLLEKDEGLLKKVEKYVKIS